MTLGPSLDTADDPHMNEQVVNIILSSAPVLFSCLVISAITIYILVLNIKDQHYMTTLNKAARNNNILYADY